MLWQLFGILLVVSVGVAVLMRPAGVLAVVLAVGVVGAAIVVSWNDVEQYRQQRAAEAAFKQENASASAVTVPPPNPAHSGS
jgi:hypothetical protein